MKEYTFTVSVEQVNIDKSFVDSLINEVANEKRQLELTKAININTRLLHRQIIEDFIKPINSELEKVNCRFSNPTFGGNVNGYENSKYTLRINNDIYTLRIEPSRNEEKFKDSIYTTHTGDYVFQIKINNSDYYMIETYDCVFKKIESSLKNHISNGNY